MVYAPSDYRDTWARDGRADRRGDRYEPPLQRPLRVYAFDPMTSRTGVETVTVEVKNERQRLRPGPAGEQVQVIDYDGAARCYYSPVDLDHPALLMTGGLTPSESDPRFHQQMVYAVAMKVIENFERALGRPIWFSGQRPLRLFPHAFRGANAFYDRDKHGIFFGYFTADQARPGRNLPNQTIFTCLSQDIIAHEVSHALVDRLRPAFLEPTNRDVYAFHEGLADIVAIFQHFSFKDILRDTIQHQRSALQSRSRLVELAGQFGDAMGTGTALRSALDTGDGPDAGPDPTLYQTVTEPHSRGTILVGAVFDAFFATYQGRIADLIRIATGGSGNLPAGALHPDLVNRIADEAAKRAQSILTMCIRAFEYLPPVDVTYGDYLRALVTSDQELVAVDEIGQRAAMIEAFRRRGIYPRAVASLAETSLVWEDRRGERDLPPLDMRPLARWLSGWAGDFGLQMPDQPAELAAGAEADGADVVGYVEQYPPVKTGRRRSGPGTRQGAVAGALHAYAGQHAAALELHPDLPVQVKGFHSVFRVARTGGLLRELVASFVQRDERGEQEGGEAFGGLPLRGGTTVIFSERGEVRFVIAKPLGGRHLSADGQRAAAERLEERRAFVAACDRDDPHMAWGDAAYLRQRMARRFQFTALHAGRGRLGGGRG